MSAQPGNDAACLKITNRLILLPERRRKLTTFDAEREDKAINIVRRFQHEGTVYVYLARCGRKVAEDDDAGVRRLGFSRDCLPYLHSVDLVVVIGDRELARRATGAYPAAEVFHFRKAADWWEASLLHLTKSLVSGR